MHPRVEHTPLQISSLNKGTIVSDIIYNPFETKILCEAKEQGAMIQNGIDMFVYQERLHLKCGQGVRQISNE